MTDKTGPKALDVTEEYLFAFWQRAEQAKQRYSLLAQRNVAGLSERERFEADLECRKALTASVEADLDYQIAVGRAAKAEGRP